LDNENFIALREAQTAVLALPGTALAPAYDLGEEHNLHPRFKRPVAERLARIRPLGDLIGR
jgi:hypothetical protein